MVTLGETNSGVIRCLATNHRTTILRVAVISMALFAIPWLVLNFVKLLLAQAPWGAVDLRLRYNEVQLWFAGNSVYTEQSNAIHAVYPPASYAMLWPLMGWLEYPHARIVAAVALAAAVVWLGIVLIKESGAETRLERAFIALLLLSMYATGFSIGHGQLTIFTIAGLVAGLTLMSSGERRWQDDLIVALFILIALVKPSLSVPFFWIVLFRAGTVRPVLLVIVGYFALTVIAVVFQKFDFYGLIQAWIARSMEGAAREAAGGAYGNIHSWLAVFGLRQWNMPASAVLLLLLGYWTYCYRHADLWLLLGVTAIVARLWVYHRSYDDVLVLLPMITLFRITKFDCLKNGYGLVAGVILTVSVIAMLFPALVLVVPGWKSVLKNSQSLLPLTMLAFLLFWGWRHKNASSRTSVISHPRGLLSCRFPASDGKANLATKL
jgi:Glycosyltransferase family 87